MLNIEDLWPVSPNKTCVVTWNHLTCRTVSVCSSPWTPETKSRTPQRRLCACVPFFHRFLSSLSSLPPLSKMTDRSRLDFSSKKKVLIWGKEVSRIVRVSTRFFAGGLSSGKTLRVTVQKPQSSFLSRVGNDCHPLWSVRLSWLNFLSCAVGTHRSPFHHLTWIGHN